MGLFKTDLEMLCGRTKHLFKKLDRGELGPESQQVGHYSEDSTLSHILGFKYSVIMHPSPLQPPKKPPSSVH